MKLTNYEQYKPFFSSGIVIVVCLFVLIEFVFPQIQQWIDTKGVVNEDTQKIAMLRENLNTLSLIDENSLDSKLAVVSSALPPVKNFVSILSAVANAASSSIVSINDYSFQVGNLSDESTTNHQITLLLTVNGGLDKTAQFISALKTQLPLSNVTQIDMTEGNTTQITVEFYTSPFTSLPFNSQQPIQPLTQKEMSIIDTLSSYSSSGNPPNTPTQ